MSASVKISAKYARTILRYLEGVTFSIADADARNALHHALAPRPKSSLRKKTDKKRRTKREATAVIRALVFHRAIADDGTTLCELNCGGIATEMHHAFGRVRVKQDERNCLALCRACHRWLTDNKGGGVRSWDAVAEAFYRLGFEPEAQRALARADALRMSRGGA